MVEHVAGTAAGRSGDGFRLYAEIYALRLRFEQQQVETLERLGAHDDVPAAVSAVSGAGAVGAAGSAETPGARARRSWLRPWR